MGCTTSISTVSKDVDRRGPLIKNHGYISNENIEIVKRTWKLLSGDIQDVGAKIFLKLFDLNPSIREIFHCESLDGDALLRNRQFRGHASRFMQAIGAAVDTIDDLQGSMGPMLEDLGRQHLTFAGFKPGYWDCFTDAILHVWKDQLHYRFTTEVAKAWKTVFVFIVLKLKEGFEKACLMEAQKNLIYS